MRPVSVAGLALLSAYPAAAQFQHGSIGVIYYTPEKLVMAADSRVLITPAATLFGTPAVSGTSDNECKISALGNTVLFVSTSITRVFGYGPLVPDWDNTTSARAAFDKITSGGTARGRVEEIANEWSTQISIRFNGLAALRPDAFQQMLNSTGAGAITAAYIGGLDNAGNPKLYDIVVLPNTLPTGVVAPVHKVPTCPYHNFCPVGVRDGLSIVSEFAEGITDRAKKESSEWKPPRRAPQRDYDAHRTKRMVELVIRYHDGTDVGGPIDFAQLQRDGTLRWISKKDNCPAN